MSLFPFIHSFVRFSRLMISPGVFFIFLKFWFSGLLGGVKVQKTDQKWQTIVHSISQEAYMIWCHLWHTSVKWWYLQTVFPFFQNVWFFWLLGGWKDKKWPKMTKKLCRSCFISQEPYIIWLLIYGTLL